MILSTYFKDFLKEIRLQPNHIEELSSAHKTLTTRLVNHDDYKDIVFTTFLQGSYKRGTALRPKNGNRSDVDIIVVTNIDENSTKPVDALNQFVPFLEEYYKDKYKIQGRSLGIEMSKVDLDLVVTTKPTEEEIKSLISEAFNNDFTVQDMAESYDDLEKKFVQKLTESALFFENKDGEINWKHNPLLIPDREADNWVETHPLEQIRWTIEKNKKCNLHFINVVKCIKWWKKVMCSANKHPKSYPLERLVAECCPDGIGSVAEGVVLTFENMVNYYSMKPILEDHGTDKDVFERITETDYKEFYVKVEEAAKLARKAYDLKTKKESLAKWKELFGTYFDKQIDNKEAKFTQRTEKSEDISTGKFA